ncbi:MAG: hypothetical protein K8F90_17755 [Hyphomicrobiales bacterium]|nr:hypothetical protein [Hyphomicrobiales bacterium]
MAAENPLPQSDDYYESISFRALGGGSGTQGPVKGTVGWREGVQNRVVFQVWDGPSFAAEGRDLTEAFAKGLDGIRALGFAPLVAGTRTQRTADPHDLFEPAGLAEIEPLKDTHPAMPKFEPKLWALVAFIFLALLIPALAHAEIPVPGKVAQFPNASFAWHYEGPDLDSRIVIVDTESGEAIARYELEGASFCDDDDDNCELDGIFPIVLASAPKEPVLGVVAHVGAHSQRLSVFRPLNDRAKPVFEATAEYALILKLMPDGLFVETDHADKDGNISREHRMWIAGNVGQCRDSEFDRLPKPPAPTLAAAELENTLRHIARNRDLRSFTELLADNVLVSFGGSGGLQEFLASLDRGHEINGEAIFWEKLDRLLASGGWSEADVPQSITWPWFFKAWPEKQDGHDAFIAGPDVLLRAGPHEHAPILAKLPFGVLRFAAPDANAQAVDWHASGWLPVTSPDHCLGYVRAQDATPLLGTRLIARHDGKNWKIEAFVAGD